MEDVHREFLSDTSLYRQVMERLGDQPIYQLSALILDLLGDGRDSIMRCASMRRHDRC